MGFKLPIKYAVEPIFPYATNSGNVLGFIVTKCYVLEATTRFYMDGNSKNLYTVVYPFKGLQTFKFMKNKRFPEINKFGHYSNTDYTDCIYDTYLEAKEKCKELNTALFTSNYPCYQLDDMLAQFDKFEDQVLFRCNDMEVTEDDNVLSRKKI